MRMTRTTRPARSMRPKGTWKRWAGQPRYGREKDDAGRNGGRTLVS